MSRTAKVFVWVIGVLALLVVALAIVVATFDWNRVKPTINE